MPSCSVVRLDGAGQSNQTVPTSAAAAGSGRERRAERLSRSMKEVVLVGVVVGAYGRQDAELVFELQVGLAGPI